MTIDNATEYGLVLSFAGLYPTMPEEHAFVHGVEFGRLWDRIRSGAEAEIYAVTHTANREIIARAAASEGWEIEVKATDVEGWDETTLRKVRTARDNPNGLRVVK
jgi:hypothetical protein